MNSFDTEDGNTLKPRMGFTALEEKIIFLKLELGECEKILRMSGSSGEIAHWTAYAKRLKDTIFELEVLT